VSARRSQGQAGRKAERRTTEPLPQMRDVRQRQEEGTRRAGKVCAWLRALPASGSGGQEEEGGIERRTPKGGRNGREGEFLLFRGRPGDIPPSGRRGGGNRSLSPSFFALSPLSIRVQEGL